jgi:hypothetical protein
MVKPQQIAADTHHYTGSAKSAPSMLILKWMFDMN